MTKWNYLFEANQEALLESDAQFRADVKRAIANRSHREIVIAYKHHRRAGGGKAGFGARAKELDTLNKAIAQLQHKPEMVRSMKQLIRRIFDKGYAVVMRELREPDGIDRLWIFLDQHTELTPMGSLYRSRRFDFSMISHFIEAPLHSMVAPELGATVWIAAVPRSSFLNVKPVAPEIEKLSISELAALTSKEHERLNDIQAKLDDET